MDYDGLTEQLDKERERAEGAEGRIGAITKQLDAAMSQVGCPPRTVGVHTCTEKL